jgi:hypothetical protein
VAAVCAPPGLPAVALPSPHFIAASPAASPCLLFLPPPRICNLVLESSSKRRGFSRHGRQRYVGRDAVAALHSLLRVAETQSLDFQAFFDLLQRCGEERRLLELSDEVRG